jgi:hypothetical protein
VKLYLAASLGPVMGFHTGGSIDEATVFVGTRRFRCGDRDWMDVGQGLQAVAAVAAFGGLLEEFRQGPIVTRTADREGMERYAGLFATRLPEARVIGADIDPRWDRLHSLWRGRRLPPNYRFVQDDVFSLRLGVRPTAVVFFGACGAVSDAAIDYAVNAGAGYLMCRTCCHDNIGGNLAITSRFSYLNWFFRFKNLACGRLQGVPKYAGYYFSPAYGRCAYPRSSAGQQLSSTEEHGGGPEFAGERYLPGDHRPGPVSLPGRAWVPRGVPE